MKHIRKSSAILAVVMALLGLVRVSGAVTNGVKYGAHNLGTTGQGNFGGGATGTAETEICIFCHTPHNAQAGKKFLWNRIASVNTFALYTASPTLNFTKAGAQLSEVSKMCMSCHDGVTALNSMANPKPMPNIDQIGDIQSAEPWGPNIGEWSVTNPSGGGNLTNDHPVSFSYAASAAGDNTIVPADGGGKSVGGGVLPLWDDGTGTYKVECVTCHDPHINYGYWSWSQQIPNGGGDTTLAPFLRRSNASSNLCFTCHNK